MPAKSFLPSNDHALLAWANNFLTRIEASPALYGFSVQQIGAFDARLSDFRAALLQCEPAMKSKSSVAAKNEARKELVKQARLAANHVNGQAAVSDAQKLLLGLTVRRKPTPTPTLTTAPLVEIETVSGWTVTLQLHDIIGSHRGKPAGAIGASVFSYTGTTPPVDVEGWKFEGNVGKTTFDVTFDSALASGTPVFFTAFWFNGRKESGPACAPVGTRLMGGTVATGKPLKIAA